MINYSKAGILRFLKTYCTINLCCCSFKFIFANLCGGGDQNNLFSAFFENMVYIIFALVLIRGDQKIYVKLAVDIPCTKISV